MTKPGDSQTKKTIHELAKEFPEKTYVELEKYRNADRQEEAIGIGHNHPPGETFKKACTLGEMKKDRSYPDLAEVLAAENDKLKSSLGAIKSCFIAACSFIVRARSSRLFPVFIIFPFSSGFHFINRHY